VLFIGGCNSTAPALIRLMTYLPYTNQKLNRKEKQGKTTCHMHHDTLKLGLTEIEIEVFRRQHKTI
jgi:hypothetical protein